MERDDAGPDPHVDGVLHHVRVLDGVARVERAHVGSAVVEAVVEDQRLALLRGYRQVELWEGCGAPDAVLRVDRRLVVERVVGAATVEERVGVATAVEKAEVAGSDRAPHQARDKRR